MTLIQSEVSTWQRPLVVIAFVHPNTYVHISAEYFANLLLKKQGMGRRKPTERIFIELALIFESTEQKIKTISTVITPPNYHQQFMI